MKGLKRFMPVIDWDNLAKFLICMVGILFMPWYAAPLIVMAMILWMD